MPSIFLLASALAFASPAGSPGSWMSDNDYPSGAVKRKEEGAVGFQLLISPKGRVARCRVTDTSGSSDLDGATCAVIMDHSKFKSATDAKGQPSYTFYNGRLTWHLPGRSGPFRSKQPTPPLPAMELTVQKLPDGSREKMVWLIASFDAAGQMTACEPSPNNPKEVKLATVACTEAKAVSTEITKDNDGNPIPLVRGLSVLFKATN
jgi:TonB family protein